MILRASVIRNSPLPMRCVPKLDCNHPIVFSKKSDKPLFFVYLVIFIHSFIHLLQEDFHRSPDRP